MTFTDATKEAAALAVTARGNLISLHEGDPGTTGANEATGGDPAYTRQETTWSGGAADGSVSGTEVTFDVPAGDYTHIGIWTDTAAFVGGLPLSSPTGALPGQTQVLVTPIITAADAV